MIFKNVKNLIFCRKKIALKFLHYIFVKKVMLLNFNVPPSHQTFFCQIFTVGDFSLSLYGAPGV